MTRPDDAPVASFLFVKVAESALSVRLKGTKRGKNLVFVPQLPSSEKLASGYLGARIAHVMAMC